MKSLLAIELVKDSNTIIYLMSPDTTIPFSFKACKFLIRLGSCITINKAQGQALGRVSFYLAQPVFSHGQLYVAMSRCTFP